MHLAIAASVTGRSLPAHIQAERTELAKVVLARALRLTPETLLTVVPLSI